MSTDIKPGQIWAWQDTFDAKGEHGYTFEIIESGTDVSYQYRDAPGYDPERTFAASAELVEANANLVRCVCRAGTEDTCAQHSATPAPLDPAKVKAGDTVTLENGTALVRDVVIEVKSRGEGQFVFYTSENPDPLVPGTYYLVNHGAWTLTDHQPAPEPEPEWEPGDMAAVTARGWVNGWSVRTAANDGWASHSDSDDVRSDAEVESVRPLVVIDPATVDVDALVRAAHLDPVLYGDTTPDQMRLAALRMLTELGIEVAR